MSDKPRKSEDAPEKPSVTLPGKVKKIIPGVVSTMPDKAQIAVEGADHLYKEIRVENTLQDENGKPVSLKPVPPAFGPAYDFTSAGGKSTAASIAGTRSVGI
jgi:hypothetical protein